MAETIEERLKALEVALENERNERTFYLKHSKRTSHPLGQKMFVSIADDELEHFKRIHEVHAKLTEKGSWPETVPIRVKSTEVRGLFKETVQSLEENVNGDTDDLEAIKIAIAFEEKAEKFYEDLAGMTENVQEKTLYMLLASLEREHMLSLKDTYEYFLNPAGWYLAKEHHSIDGG